MAKADHSRGGAQGIDGPQPMWEVQVIVAKARGRDRGRNRLATVEVWGRNVDRSGWANPQGWQQLKLEAATGARGEDDGSWAGG